MAKTTNSGDEYKYNVLTDAENILAGLQWEHDHPATPGQRIREFLVGQLGSEWQQAQIASHPFGEGTAHVVMLQANMQHPQVVLMVGEDRAGELTMPVPAIDLGQAREVSQDRMEAYSKLRRCLAEITSAFSDVAQIVEAAEIPGDRKKELTDQLSHAASHLVRYLKTFL